ncbi:MAG: hypothetical protein AAGG80_04020 [Pseudomonadota bacterium]
MPAFFRKKSVSVSSSSDSNEHVHLEDATFFTRFLFRCFDDIGALIDDMPEAKGNDFDFRNQLKLISAEITDSRDNSKQSVDFYGLGVTLKEILGSSLNETNIEKSLTITSEKLTLRFTNTDSGNLIISLPYSEIYPPCMIYNYFVNSSFNNTPHPQY